ncbi:MAG: hypothetical protein IJT72_03585 [Lachnospiraceae bacterium]|nr:hypothetical protein [Lachnospiraceae bacterium]
MKKAIILSLVFMFLLCGCKKNNESENNSIDWKKNETTEKTTEATTTEATTEENSNSLEGLPCVINWQGYGLRVESIDAVSLSDFNFSGVTVPMEGYSTLYGNNFAMVVVIATASPIQTNQITMDSMKEFVLADVYGNTYELVRYNYPDIVYSDANGFEDAQTQPMMCMLYKTADDTEYDKLMLCVGDEKAVSEAAANAGGAPAVTTEDNDTSGNGALSIFDELAGSWSGKGKPVGGGSDIALTVDINTDGSGVYTFVQGAYEESYSFTLVENGNSFSVNIPTDNKLGIDSCGGTYEYDGSILTLHIKTTFANGGAYEYDADLTKK